MSKERLREGEVGGSRRGTVITFQHLTYTVRSNVDKGQKVDLLADVSGHLQPCKMTALMGPSGSGKTTLLDVLAGRTTVGRLSGDIKFGGRDAVPAFVHRYTGYVEQFDTLISTLSVEEMLLYTAELKREQSEPLSSKAAAVSQLIEELGLGSCRHVRIGDSLTKGISGGQAKRTNIGMALIADPCVLFLDEPTSGLDSFSANEVTAILRGLSQSGVTVVATIHSPSSHAFAMFDRLLLLARGRTVYFGPQGDTALQFARQFWQAPGSPQVEGSLPEQLMDLVTEADRCGKAAQLADMYEASDLRRCNDTQLAALCCHSRAATSSDGTADMKLQGDQPTEALAVLVIDATLALKKEAVVAPEATMAGSTRSSRQQAGHGAEAGTVSLELSAAVHEQLGAQRSTTTAWWWAVWVLLKYRARRNFTYPQWVVPRVGGQMLLALLTLTLYLNKGNDFSNDNLVNMSASLFMFIELPGFSSLAYAPSIVLERRRFLRERSDGLYYVGTYYVAKMVEELLLAVPMSIIFASIVFYGVQYQGSFLLFWVVYMLVIAIGVAIGYLVAAISPNMDVTNAALCCVFMAVFFFAGYLATFDSIPVYYKWCARANFGRYSWVALMVSQFNGNDPPFALDGRSVLTYFGISEESKWANAACLLAFYAGYAVLGYLAMSYVRHEKR